MNNNDIFDDIPDYTLDDIDKTLDVLNQLAINFCEHINLARETLDSIEDKILELKNSISNYSAEIIELNANLIYCQTEIKNLHHELQHSNVIFNDDEYESILYDIECDLDLYQVEEIAINETILELENKIERQKTKKTKLIQNASNILYLTKIKLNEIQQYKLD